MSTYPRFKGAPFNPHTIRWHRTRHGHEWQYWNVKVGRWCRYTKEPLTEALARERMAQWCFGCDPKLITVEHHGRPS